MNDTKGFVDLYKALDSYNKKYVTIDSDNAQNAIDDFDEQWKTIMTHSADGTPNSKSNYGQALVNLSVAIHKLSNPSEKQINWLSDLIDDFEIKENFGNHKMALFYNLGLCWHTLGDLYNSKIIEAFKKHLYYLLLTSNQEAHSPAAAYSFRKCTTFLYQSLINDELNISAPSAFNDPFDSPIVEKLKSGNDLSKLMYQAFQNSLKIACFTCNIRQPRILDKWNRLSTSAIDMEKNKNDRKEYQNELMWAHYANYHRGICIKYSFSLSITDMVATKSNRVSFFKDVNYSDEDLSEYSSLNKMLLEDAFFLKGKAWEYENELRYVCFDINGQGDYGTVSIPNCIEAIYFGLKCSDKDRKAIFNIMKNKKFIKKDFKGNVLVDKPIDFFKMEMDEEHFGQIKAVPYSETNESITSKD